MPGSIPRIILSVIIAKYYQSLSSAKWKRYNSILRFLIPFLAILTLLYTLDYKGFDLRLPEIAELLIFSSLILLSFLNLIIETSVWMLLLKNDFRLSQSYLFRIICSCYTLRSLSLGFIGSVFGKLGLFGLRRLRQNIRSNIKFGLYQTLGTMLPALAILSFSGLSIENWSLHTYSQIIIGILIPIFFVSLIFLKSHFSIRISALAILRTSIYFIQFGIVIYQFYLSEIFYTAISIIAFYFILKTLFPILNIFGGLGIRELSLAFLFNMFGLQTESVILGSFMIWVANFVLPNLLGIVFIAKDGNWKSPSYS